MREQKLSMIWLIPRIQLRFRSFLGLLNHLRAFLGPSFADVACPLYDLTSGEVLFIWTPLHHQTFELLKEAVVQPLTLCHPNWDLDFVLRVDSSQKGVGATLYNVDESGEYLPVSYFFIKHFPII